MIGYGYASEIGRIGPIAVDDPALLAPVQWGTLHFAGLEVLAPFVAYGAARGRDDERAAILTVWRERLRGIERETPERLAPPGS